MGQSALKQKKIPTRQCLGCNEHKPKKELLRVLRTPEGEIVLDFTGKKSGRGAYICYDVKCLKKARKSMMQETELQKFTVFKDLVKGILGKDKTIELLQEAEELMQYYDYEMAIQKYNRFGGA